MVQADAEDFAGGKIVGERFGRYLLVGEIAVGGMAEVFLAVHKGLEGFIKVVVIKRVLPHFTNHAEFVQMFIDEARLVTRLEHPNIVRTYEFGEVDGHYFTAMEYLPGEELGKVLNTLAISRQLMPIHIATGIAAQLCTGLHFAHQFTDPDGRPLNLVHRDINPVNIIVTFGGEAKIIDFGVAKSDANPRTVTGTIKGKVAYMPPEQILGRSVDQRADIFSAGVVLWEMLTGQPLFLRDNEAATLYAIVNGPIAPPSNYRPDVPQPLDKIVVRALARSPADRYATAEDMAAALDDVLAHMPRYDSRALAGMMEQLFGPTRADAKRAIAQTRSLARNVSLVMKLRKQVPVELAEVLDDAAVISENTEAETLPHHPVDPTELDPGSAAAPPPVEAVVARSHRGLVIALTAVMVTGIAAGLAYVTARPDREHHATTVASTSLRVASTPPGAAVFVDGEPTGWKTPTTLTGLTARKLSIRLELPAHQPVTEVVDVVAGTTISRNLTLPAMAGRLVFSNLPVNAGVFIDDTEYSAGELITIAPGAHIVRIVVDDRTITQQEIETVAGDQGWKLAHGKLIRN